MYQNASLMSGTTSWFHEQIETCLRRCFEQVLAQTTPEPSGGRPPEVGELSLWMAVIVVLLRRLRSQRASLPPAGGWGAVAGTLLQCGRSGHL